MPIAMMTTIALAKKMRFVSEEIRLITLPRHPEVRFDNLAFRDGHLAWIGMAELAPDQQGVVAGWNRVDCVAPVVICHGEERVAEHENVSAHVRVDVAGDRHDAGRVEPVATVAPRRIAA